MLLHAIDDFALDADSLDNMSREVDELMEQMRAEAEAEPPTQSAAAGNSGEAAAEPAADLTTANANASATTAAASVAAVQLAAMAAEAAAGAQGADASAPVAAQPAAPSTSARVAVVAARANAAQIAGAPADAADAAGDDGIVPFRPRGGASRFGTTMRTDADVVRSASRGRARTLASQSAFSEHGLWQVETPGDGSCLYHATGHLLHGPEALAELECGGAIVAMVLREHVAARIEQSVSARSFVLQALEWRVHDTSQQGAKGGYNREDERDTWMDDAHVREMNSAAEAAYQSGEVEAFDVAEPAIMAAVATCIRNGAWGTELECAELNEWLDMYGIELRCVSSVSRVADVRSSRALVGLLYRQGAHCISMATADNQTLFEPSRFALPAPVEAARPRIAGGSSSAQQRGDTRSAAMPQPLQEDRGSSPSTSPSTRRGRSRHRGQGQGATAGARSFQIVCMRSYAGHHHHEGISRRMIRYYIRSYTSECLKACNPLRGSLHCTLSATVYVGERSAAQVTEQPRAQHKRAANAATRDRPQFAACSALPGEHAPRARRVRAQSANAGTTRAHQARARATQGEGALEGRNARRRDPAANATAPDAEAPAVRSRSLGATRAAVAPPRARSASAAAALGASTRRAVRNGAEPAVSRAHSVRDAVLQAPKVGERHGKPVGLPAHPTIGSVVYQMKGSGANSNLAPGKIECHGWVSFNILMLLLWGKCAIVVVDGDASLHKALLTFGWQLASVGVKHRCIHHVNKGITKWCLTLKQLARYERADGHCIALPLLRCTLHGATLGDHVAEEHRTCISAALNKTHHAHGSDDPSDSPDTFAQAERGQRHNTD